jgi:hypothetical protein
VDASLLGGHLLSHAGDDGRDLVGREGFHPHLTLAFAPHAGGALAEPGKELSRHTVIGRVARQAAVAADALHHISSHGKELE